MDPSEYCAHVFTCIPIVRVAGSRHAMATCAFVIYDMIFTIRIFVGSLLNAKLLI